MSKDSFIDNLYRAASRMISQFSTEEPLISNEAKEMLDDANTKQELVDKIIANPTPGEVKVGEVVYFVEA